MNFDVAAAARKLNSFVVLVDGNGKTLLRFVLSDHVFVEKAFDLGGFGKRRAGGNRFRLLIVG